MGSQSDQLVVHITDTAGKTATVTVTVATFDELITTGWTQVDVDLTVLDVDLSQVAQLTLAVGARGNAQNNAFGTIFIEDIRLYIAAQ